MAGTWGKAVHFQTALMRFFMTRRFERLLFKDRTGSLSFGRPLWSTLSHMYKNIARIPPKLRKCVGASPILTAFTASLVVKASENVTKKKENEVVMEADVLYSQNQTDELYDYLRRFQELDSSAVAWRLARAACNKAKNCDAKSEERKQFMYEAYGYAKRSVELDETCGDAHRWMGVMLNYVGDYEGNKQKIKYSYIVKEHFKRAIQLNPRDATSMYCLGQWCFFFADMSWYIKKVASVIFASPPSSTFQEALNYFLMAERVDPDFYSMNHLMLARTYMKLNEPAKAKGHLMKARDLPVKSADDKQAHDESIELLGKL